MNLLARGVSDFDGKAQAGALGGIEIDAGVQTGVAVALAHEMVTGAGRIKDEGRAGVEFAFEGAHRGAGGIEQAYGVGVRARAGEGNRDLELRGRAGFQGHGHVLLLPADRGLEAAPERRVLPVHDAEANVLFAGPRFSGLHE